MKGYLYAFAALLVLLIGSVVVRHYVKTPEPELALATLSSAEPRPAQWAQSVDASYHLYQMDELLYRSALPQEHDVQWLQQQNVKTVINFYQKPDSAWLHDDSIEQVQIPLRTDRIDDVDVLRVLSSIASAQEKGAVLMHCKHGQNRTGLIAAMYRMVFEGWSKADAMAEMQLGYGGEERMDGATRYLTQVDVAAIEQALASGACSTQSLAWCKVAGWLQEQVNKVWSNPAQQSSAWAGHQQNVLNPAET
ncbi:MAG: dual specificity protein phosphatase family protein [Pseudomonas sp.]|nr:dual specificity protein phosphatase family protein [Pseudomonas sp.]